LGVAGDGEAAHNMLVPAIRQQYDKKLKKRAIRSFILEASIGCVRERL
jgi:hypothetical protein